MKEELRLLLEAPSSIIPDVEASLGNPAWDEAGSRILIVRLSPQADVERSSPHLLLFAECRAALATAYIDFAFLPSRQDRAVLEGAGFPWFYGLASGHSPADFDLIMVSNAYSLELLNLPWLFSTAGIPMRSSLRLGSPIVQPIVILGGSNAAATGSLLFPPSVGEADGAGQPAVDEASYDCFVDGIFFGEGEGAIGELARILTEPGRPAGERLASAAGVEGFWASRSGNRARRRVADPLSPVSYPILNGSEAGTARLQISAGCPGLCSFCFEGWDRRPYREVPLDVLLASARGLRARTGADTLEVYSFNFNTHEEIFSLLFELNRIFRRVNLMSQRLDILATTVGLVRAELAADKRSFTLGIEGCSKRMRAYFRKGLAEEELAGLMENLVVPGVRELKLFYIVAGIEKDEDLAEFADFIRELADRRRRVTHGMRILVSAGYLSRLPFTPLQYAPLGLEHEPLSRITDTMRGACERGGIEFRLASHFDEYCADQVLALGGSALAPWIETAPRRGIIYDGDLSRGAWNSMREHATATGLLGPEFLGEKAQAWLPPLSFLETPMERLWKHYVAARRFKDRKSCLGSECSDCGACQDGDERAALTGHETRAMSASDFPDRVARLLAAKAAFSPVHVAVELPQVLQGASSAYRASWILRRLSGASKGAEHAAFEAREALCETALLDPETCSFVGKTVYALFGPEPRKLAEAAKAAGFAPLDGPSGATRFEVEVSIPMPFAHEADAALRAWLAQERVSFTEERSGEGRRLVPSQRDIKKRIIVEVLLGPMKAGCFTARLVLGPKARLGDWLGRLGKRGAAAARVTVLAFD